MADNVLMVPCPVCEAQAGRLCEDGELTTGLAHMRRWEAAMNAAGLQVGPPADIPPPATMFVDDEYGHPRYSTASFQNDDGAEREEPTL